jgi:ATP-dependent DNA helicase RecG
VIAPVFKLLGIIDQWGNGLKLIADELKAYPEIEFRWKEVGLSFQVQFVKRNFKAEIESRQELGQELGQELRQERKEKTMFTFILIHLQQESLSRSELANALGLKTISGHLNRTIAKLKEHGLIEFTIPDKSNHPDQKFRITERGIVFIELVKK